MPKQKKEVVACTCKELKYTPPLVTQSHRCGGIFLTGWEYAGLVLLAGFSGVIIGILI